jgi:hypothetical protein
VKNHSQVKLRFFDMAQEEVVVVLLVGALAFDEAIHVLPENRSSLRHTSQAAKVRFRRRVSGFQQLPIVHASYVIEIPAPSRGLSTMNQTPDGDAPAL